MIRAICIGGLIFVAGWLAGQVAGDASARPVTIPSIPPIVIDVPDEGEPSGGACSYEPGVSGEYHDGKHHCPTLRSIRVDAQGYVITSDQHERETKLILERQHGVGCGKWRGYGEVVCDAGDCAWVAQDGGTP